VLKDEAVRALLDRAVDPTAVTSTSTSAAADLDPRRSTPW